MERIRKVLDLPIQNGYINWEKLENKMKIPTVVKRIRGKLNVPRERFRTTKEGLYVWAGKELYK